MLIRFTTINFLSFRDETEFLMLPADRLSKTRHTIKPKKSKDFSLLQSGVIYGANSAGKSNLLKAIDVAKKIIEKPLNKEVLLPDYRFKLDENSKKSETSFEFEIKIGEQSYAYGFSFSPDMIKEEWLYKIYKNKEDVKIFEREGYKVNLNKKIIKNNKSYKRLSFIAEELFPNQLFLTMLNYRNISEQNDMEDLISVYSWIKNSLIILFPDSQYTGTPVWGMNNNFAKVLEEMLLGFDTGIKRMKFIEVPIEELYKKIDRVIIDDITSRMQVKSSHYIQSSTGEHLLITKTKDAPFIIKKLVTYHDDSNTYFEINEESDGTKRIIDLLPLFLNFFQEKECTILVDELDRSLHTELSYKFMELFFQFAKNQNIQFILSSHDTGLLDLKLFRKDEIWFVEKDETGASKIYSLADFKVRDDLKLEKGYLNGRFGAIPFFGNNLEAFIEELKQRI